MVTWTNDPNKVPVSYVEMVKALRRANGAAFKKVGLVNSRTSYRNLLEHTGDKATNWSRVYLRFRSRWCRKLLKHIPAKHKRIREFIRVWVFAL